jgi:hypothetical protein
MLAYPSKSRSRLFWFFAIKKDVDEGIILSTFARNIIWELLKIIEFKLLKIVRMAFLQQRPE